MVRLILLNEAHRLNVITQPLPCEGAPDAEYEEYSARWGPRVVEAFRKKKEHDY